MAEDLGKQTLSPLKTSNHVGRQRTEIIEIKAKQELFFIVKDSLLNCTISKVCHWIHNILSRLAN